MDSSFLHAFTGLTPRRAVIIFALVVSLQAIVTYVVVSYHYDVKNESHRAKLHKGRFRSSNELTGGTMKGLDRYGVGTTGRSRGSAEGARLNDTSASNDKERCTRVVTIYMEGLNPLTQFRAFIPLHEAFHNNTNTGWSRNTGMIPTLIERCPEYKCDIRLQVTDDISHMIKSHVVILSLLPLRPQYSRRSANISNTLLKTLTNETRLIFYAMEPPTLVRRYVNSVPLIRHHHSMTYHSDSEVHFPYGRYIAGEPMDSQSINYAATKSKLVVWVASNCVSTSWPRRDWVRAMQKELSVDIYGNCGNLNCQPWVSEKCYKEQRVYKFNLALENSPCEEYITEKFWKGSLDNGLVPVVYGAKRSTYERVAPPNSFIHVADFSSVHELADYLIKLDKDDNLYNKYFKWRTQGRVESYFPYMKPATFCRVLGRLAPWDNRTAEVKLVGDSGFYRGCRNGPSGQFAKAGDINTWEPWR